MVVGVKDRATGMKIDGSANAANLPSLGRRSFLWGAAVAATAPIVTEAVLAQTSLGAARAWTRNVPPADAVLINANENPLGPSKGACEAISRIAPMGGRYDQIGVQDEFIQTFASQHGLKPENVAVYPGSSEPLHYTVLAFTSPSRGLVTADPSYEAPTYAAAVTGAPIHKVALTPDCAHDVKAMVAADPSAGVIYICNPNNPTGTVTARQDILWALEHKPAGSILLVDEAYIHLSDEADVLDMVAAGKDLIVLRTFSKVYGMAGIRCGVALGRPDLLAKLVAYGQNAMPVTALAAAHASLIDADLVPTRKAIIGDIRRETLSWLKAGGYKVMGEPHSNCFMIDTGRPGHGVITAMQARNVYIGRIWPIWPTAVRITVGSAEDMARFKTAFKAVMDAPAVASAAPLPSRRTTFLS
jgi:histidinol-phosphate aminotransferase